MDISSKIKETPIDRLLLHFIVPAVISTMLVSVRYIIDTVFANRVGEACQHAVNTAFPYITMIQSLGYFVGMGTASIYSKKMGRKCEKKLGALLNCGFWMSVFIGVGITAIGCFRPDVWLHFFVSGKTVDEQALVYIKIISSISVVMMISFYAENVLRAMGKLVLVLIAISIGILANIICAIVLGDDIIGIAFSFLAGQCITALILYFFFYKEKRKKIKELKILQNRVEGRLNKEKIVQILSVVASIAFVGIPSLVRQGFGCLFFAVSSYLSTSLNSDVQTAQAILNKISLLVFSVAIGCSQAMQPLVGYFYGANKIEQIKTTFMKCCKYGTVGTALMSVVVVVFSNQLLSFFTNEKEVLHLIKQALPYQLLIFLFVMPANATNMLYQACNKPVVASLLAALRQGLFGIPAVIILTSLANATGLLLAQTIADGLTIVVSVLFAWRFFTSSQKWSPS